MKILPALLILISFSVTNCKKKAKSVTDNPVPSTLVNLRVFPGDPSNFRIQSIGGWEYISGGINGIILWRKSDQEFVAIERTSSQLPANSNAKVKVLNDNFTLRDSISGSTWRIIDGVVLKGPAQWPLRLYGTSYDGSTLLIQN